MNTISACPAPANLQDYLLGRMSEAMAASVEAHLTSCPECRKLLPTIRVEDDFVAAFRSQAGRPQPRNALLDRLAGDLRGLLRSLPTGHDATPPADAEATPAPVGPATGADEDVRALLAPPQQPDEMGRLGDYRVLKVLGSGGMGVVFLAEDTRLRRRVAVKAMRPSLAANVKARERFLREAQLTASITHDHVVAVHQVGEQNSVPFLAMPLLQGESLDARLKREGRLPLAEVLRIGRETAEGLAAAHEHGLIHRDIKPANLWLETRPGEPGGSSPRYRVKVLDFGLARAADGDAHLTQTGVVVGTPAYMSPEQARGEKVDARGDLFSLGCVLYKLLTGKTPFAGDSAMAMLMALATDTPKPVRDLNPDVPADLSDLMMRLLEKDPAQRPQSAGEVIRALRAFDGAPTVERLPAARPVPASGGRKRRPWALAAVAAGFLAIVTVATVVIIRYTNKNGKLEEIKVVLPEGAHDPKVTIKPDDAPNPTPAKVDDAWVKQVAALSAGKQAEAVAAKLKELNPGFDGKATPGIEDGVVAQLEFLTDEVTDVSPVRALTKLKRLICRGSAIGKGRLSELSPLKGVKLTQLDCGYNRVSDLSPLEGMPLENLSLWNTPVAQLGPLQQVMTLNSLDCTGTRVSDLGPLKGMHLKFFSCRNTAVTDLSPLKGMPLFSLDCGGTQASDFSPLRESKLTAISGEFKPERDGEILRSIKTLEQINGKPAKEFLGPTGAAVGVDDAWVKRVAALPPPKQLEAVAGKLKELNPGFDGKVDSQMELGDVTSLVILNDDVTNISPVRALAELKNLACRGSHARTGRLSDLAPLKGMELTSLDCGDTQVEDLSPVKAMRLIGLGCERTKVADLSPLKGMKLTHLSCGGTPVFDLSPLKGMPLTYLICDASKVSDLSPLKGMPLTALNCAGTKVHDLSSLKGMPLTELCCDGAKVSDLSPLKGMPLVTLRCSETGVSDLSPLRGMPLTTLGCDGTKVSDLSPLKGMPLKELHCDFVPERDTEVLRSIPTLETINEKPAAEFWKEFGDKKPDKGP